MQTQNSNGPLSQPRSYPNLLTLVIPMYNEGSVVALLRSVLDEFMAEVKGETEVILVNDGSTDSTLAQIAAWAYEDPRVKVPRGQMIPSDPLPSLPAVQRTSVLYHCKRN